MVRTGLCLYSSSHYKIACGIMPFSHQTRSLEVIQSGDPDLPKGTQMVSGSTKDRRHYVIPSVLLFLPSSRYLHLAILELSL